MNIFCSSIRVGIVLPLVFLSCQNSKEKRGSAQIRVVINSISATDIDVVQITVSGPNIDPDITAELPGNAETGWSGVINNIPAGADRVFLGEAFDSEGTLLYHGDAQGIVITADETVSVILYLQQSTSPDPFFNSTPRITSLVFSDSEVSPGGTVAVSVAAYDPDPEDLLTYHWSAESGVYANPEEPSTNWTAPEVPGEILLSVSVSDSEGAEATTSLSINVREEGPPGAASVVVAVNNWPVVDGLYATPFNISPGATVELDLIASDPDNDELLYDWTSNCDGAFSSIDAEDPSFTLFTDSDSGECVLEVTIEDGRGGVNTAGIAIEVYSSTQQVLHACKTSGWRPNTRYQLIEDIVDIPGDCFVIDAPGVILEGNNHTLSSLRRQDILWVVGNALHPTLFKNNTASSGTDPWVPLWTTPYSWENYTRHFNAADMDADGDLDLVTPAYSERLRVFENSGAGDFGTASVFDIGGGMGYDASRWIDFDLDGDLDFFVVHDGGNEIFYRGTGTTNNFEPGYSENLGLYTHQVEVGNFDNDEKLDIIVGNDRSGPRLRLNKLSPSGGSFSSGWESGYSGMRERTEVVADFNGDNTYDLFLSSSDNGRGALLYLGDGSGTQFTLVWSKWSAYPFRAVDMDADGDVDILIYTMVDPSTIGGVEIYLNNGNANFTLFQIIDGHRLVGIGDLDQDGFIDLVLSGATFPSNSSVEVWRNNGPGQSFSMLWSSTQPGIATDQSEIRDFDNDGDLDGMFTINSGGDMTSRIAYLENDGQGSFIEAWAEYPAVDSSGFMCALGDMDGPVAAAISIRAPNVTVRNFRDIRGFSNGVAVNDNSAAIENVVVSGFDLNGILIDRSENTTIRRFTTNHFYRGVGISFRNSAGLVIEDTNLCDSGYHRSLSRISIYCFNSSGLSGNNNKIKLNNGCLEVANRQIGWSSCR